MDEEFRKHLIDYFTSAELVDLLDIQVEDLLECILEEIEDKIDALKEYMKYGN